jgi:hypothetical protein
MGLLSESYWATSPTLPHKTPCLRGHRKSNFQSDNVISYRSVSSHYVDYIQTTALCGDSPLTRTPHFCRSHWDSGHIHHRKNLLSGIRNASQRQSNVGIRQFIHEILSARLQFLYVVSHRWQCHTKLWWSFQHRLSWVNLNGPLCCVKLSL